MIYGKLIESTSNQLCANFTDYLELWLVIPIKAPVDWKTVLLTKRISQSLTGRPAASWGIFTLRQYTVQKNSRKFVTRTVFVSRVFPHAAPVWTAIYAARHIISDLSTLTMFSVFKAHRSFNSITYDVTRPRLYSWRATGRPTDGLTHTISTLVIIKYQIGISDCHSRPV